MKLMRVFLFITTTAFSGLMWAATPGQVGAYIGTMKLTYYFDGGKSVQQVPVLLNISADDSTTFTVSGVQWNTLSRFLNTASGGAVLHDPAELPNNNIMLAVYNFKKKTVKGSITGVINSNDPTVFIRSVEGRFRLKKIF